MTQISDRALFQLEQRGISPEEFQRQLSLFERGVESAKLDRACAIGDGIIKVDESMSADLQRSFEKHTSSTRIVKFVPASGAASRMFKHLHTRNSEDGLFREFKEKFRQFPFYQTLSATLSEQGKNLDSLVQASEWESIIEHIMQKPGLNYSNAPKGMVHFHDYGKAPRTAFEEQLVEAVEYAKGQEGSVVHFTVPAGSQEAIEPFLNEKRNQLGLDNLTISYSIQEPFSDTVAVDASNTPVFSENGQLVFRPGGHGALIHNLNGIEADLIFIKNIDNVAPDRLKGETTESKKLLGGMAIALTQERNELLVAQDLEATTAFIRTYFDPQFEGSLEDARKLLDRPLRVCGMVKNTGEPGGGPHWVKTGARVTCQIIEKAQINLADPEQSNILSNSTHFNPVDLVCSVTSPEGAKYDLLDYVDHESSFISEKSFEGQSVKALELPGLWNGAMAFWNTVFVEVPISTFSPVKTVNDLLRPEHQV